MPASDAPASARCRSACTNSAVSRPCSSGSSVATSSPASRRTPTSLRDVTAAAGTSVCARDQREAVQHIQLVLEHVSRTRRHAREVLWAAVSPLAVKQDSHLEQPGLVGGVRQRDDAVVLVREHRKGGLDQIQRAGLQLPC